MSITHADVEISGGKVVGISQSSERAAEHFDGYKTKDAAQLRDDLKSGEKVVLILGEGQGAIAQASGWDFSPRERPISLSYFWNRFAYSLVNATTIKGLVNALGLTDLPAVKNDAFQCLGQCGGRL